MPISKDKTSVLINMNKELKAELEERAKAENRSLTNYINTVLEQHIKENTDPIRHLE